MLTKGITVFIVILLGSAPAWAAEVQIRDETDRISYSVGHQMGRDFKMQKVQIRPELFLKGIQDAMHDSEPLISYEEMRETLLALKTRVVAIQREQARAEAEKNLKEGQAFLEQNARDEGIVTLPSGLQYKIIAEGEGEPPGPSDTVTVHYRGTLIDGTEFDSSYGRNQPATFRLDSVIKGWTEGLQLMKPGGKYMLFVPPALAYGTRGAGARIKPNSTLVFEVELLLVDRE